MPFKMTSLPLAGSREGSDPFILIQAVVEGLIEEEEEEEGESVALLIFSEEAFDSGSRGVVGGVAGIAASNVALKLSISVFYFCKKKK